MARKSLGKAAAGTTDLTTLADINARWTSGSTANGIWRKRPDGVIEQSGTVTLASGVATITFPIPFPTACESLDLTPRTTSTAIQDPSVYETAAPGLASAAIGGSLTTVGLNALVGAGTFVVAWRAVGS